MRIPMWITLKRILDELLSVVPEIVGRLGELLGIDRNYEFFAD